MLKSSTSIFKRLFAFALGVILFSSCSKDEDENSDVFLWTGSWTCTEIEGDFSPQTYAVEIVEKVEENTVAIKGLYNQGFLFSVEAEVSGLNIEIPVQTVDGIVLSGYGNMDEDYEAIDLQFTANDGSGNDNVVAKLLR